MRSLRSFAVALLPASVIAAVVATAIAATPASPPVTMSKPPAAPAPSGSPPPIAVASYQREVADLVARMLEEVQYEAETIDDPRSEVWFDEYLDRLDPGRMILRQSDVDEFRQWRRELDDGLAARPVPKVEPAVQMYERWRTRYAEWARVSAELARGPLDLTNDEDMVVDRREQGLPWPSTDAEARDLWRQRVEEDLIDGLLAGRDSEEVLRERIAKRYERFGRTIADFDADDMLEVYLGSLSQSFDPHSVWLPPAENENFNIDITNSVVGIGAQLSVDDEYVVVNEVIRGGPAQKSGKIRKKDRILFVAQDAEEPTDVVGMRLDKVVALIRGKKGSVVRLTVEHDDGTREEIELVREQVALQEQRASSAVEEHGGRKLGVLTLPSFYVDPNGDRDGHTASADLARELGTLKTAGVEGVILDLRGNGGGSLAEAVSVAGLFLPGGPVVQIRDRSGGIEALRDDDPGLAWGGPLVVMTDATSASASEIVAGALQDYGRALIVGDPHTHGKGTVQQVIDLTRQLRGRYDRPVGGAFKVSIQKFYRVSGGSTQLKGVAADVVLPSAWEGWDVFEGDLDHAMDWDRIPPAPFARSGDLSAALPELQAKSAARVASDPDFAKQRTITEERLRRKDAKTVSLSLEERRAELAAWKALTGEEDVDTSGLSDEEKKKLARSKDHGLDEGAAVLVDLLAVATPRK
jgi:carboxyl-terminal processing protease